MMLKYPQIIKQLSEQDKIRILCDIDVLSNKEYKILGIPAVKTAKFSQYGKQDFPAILRAAEKAGSSWVVVEQDNPSMELTPMECAEKSRVYLKSIGC